MKAMIFAVAAILVSASAQAANYTCEGREWFSKEEGTVRIEGLTGFSFKDGAIFGEGSFCGTDLGTDDCRVLERSGSGSFGYVVKCVKETKNNVRFEVRGSLAVSTITGVGRFSCVNVAKENRKTIEFNNCKED